MENFHFLEYLDVLPVSCLRMEPALLHSLGVKDSPIAHFVLYPPRILYPPMYSKENLSEVISFLSKDNRHITNIKFLMTKEVENINYNHRLNHSYRLNLQNRFI